MNNSRGSYRLEYCRTDSGREPVAEWLDNRPAAERAKVFWVLERLAESGFLLGPPWLRKLDDDIWEVRLQYGASWPRILFYRARPDILVLLQAFSKKTKKTPKRELDTARGRMSRDEQRRAREAK